MIDEQRDVSEQPQKKLGVPVAEQPFAPSKKVQRVPIPPPYFPPLDPPRSVLSTLTNLKHFWRRDSASKVMIVVTAVPLIAGLIFGTLATGMLSQSLELFLRNGPIVALPQQAPKGVTPQGTVDFHPTFPTPGGGQGSTDSSQPPMGPTPVVQDTPPTMPTPQPTPIQQGGQLIVQITSIPTQVSNHSLVPVQVITNEPDISVQLYVSYNVPPGFYTSRTQVTDGNGYATLSWTVNVFSFLNRRGANARLVAIGQDQNGQQVSSQVFTVEILG
ncbi:MAG TPA: hypothetical protein VFA10_11210 [Ktedonobacteraceae bacterium]|nr:hypothetical protein [Ktedonobacteraceae bacterium]